MVQDIANVNGVKTLVSEVKFQKITSENLFWRNCLIRLVQPKLSNIQNDSNHPMIATSKMIFRRILNICFCIHHFLLQRAKFSYRQLIQLGTSMLVLIAAVRMEGECQMRHQHENEDDCNADVHDFSYVFESCQRASSN